MVARIVGNGFHHAAVGNWLVDVVQACLDPAIGLSTSIAKCFHVPIQRQPVAVARNLAVKTAKERNVSFLFMVDDDMGPPAGWFEFVLRTMGSDHATGMTPCVIGAPACAGNGMVNVWDASEKEQSFLLNVSRQEAVKRDGLQSVGNIGAGLIAYDMRVFDHVEPPYFQMQFNDDHTDIVFGEESYLHYNLRRAGISINCTWQFWARHLKPQWLDKPNERNLDVISFSTSN